jgi:hypothetical protein
VEWVKKIGQQGGADGGWKDDLPLNHELPERLDVDCTGLKLPIHPMFAVRLRVFLEWHRQEGRQVEVTLPADAAANRVFRELQIDPRLSHDRAEGDNDAILPVTQVAEAFEVEGIARVTREILEYQLTDVSPLGQAAFMAVAELCDNAIDHGKNALGAFVAARRVLEPRRQVSIAIGDLGIGIGTHQAAIPRVERRRICNCPCDPAACNRDRRSTSRHRLLGGFRCCPDQIAARCQDGHPLCQRLLPSPGCSAEPKAGGLSCRPLQARNLDRLRSGLSLTGRHVI